MSTTDDFEARYIETMLAEGDRRVELDVTLATLVTVVAAVQLALRHPHFPARPRHALESFLAQTIRIVRQEYPVIAEGISRGNHPTHDVAVGGGE